MKKMRKITDSKLFWWIVSFLLSLSIWIYVTSVETVEATKTFQVRVELVGEDTILNMWNLVVTDVDTNIVTLEIRGPRRVINALEENDLVAQVDVSRLSQPAYTSLNYEIVYPSGTDRRSLTVVSRSKSAINFMVSKQTSKPIPVVGGFEGSVGEGYTKQTPVFEPTMITVSGPEVYLKNIDRAYVTFGKDITVTSTYSVETGYTLLDANNEPCSTTEITTNPETIRATLPILEMKEVPLHVGILEGAGATAENTKITIEPKNVTLAGDSAILSGLNQFVLDTVDLTDFATTYTATYSIPIPNELFNLTGVTEATVTIEIIGLETRNILIPGELVTWINATESMAVEIMSENIEITLRGPAEILDKLEPEDIRIEVDLTELRDSIGTSMVPIKIYVDDHPEVGAIYENIVAVKIERVTE